MAKEKAFLPQTEKKRIVIAGGGFAGLELAKNISGPHYQVVLIDKQNYHQFQPLLYQVAMAGLEPSSISFPLRKIFHKKKDFYFRMAGLQKINPEIKTIYTDIGEIDYDYLVLALGVDTNFFGIESVGQHTIPMKTVPESIYLRNRILLNFEEVLNRSHTEDINPLLTYVIVGGGPTGVELAGALAEMKKFVLPVDYSEIDHNKMNIYLVEALPRLLSGMTEKSGETARKYLERLGVKVMLNAEVTRYDGEKIYIKDREPVRSKTVIWAAGVSGKRIEGLSQVVYSKTNRLQTDEFNELFAHPNIFVIGDQAHLPSKEYPEGHPQLAQVAIQQGKNLARNFDRLAAGRTLKPFDYKHKGSMPTVGRKLAVADLPKIRLKGFTAWIIWLFIHLMQLVGIRNRFFVFINWWWNYVLYDQSLRVLIRPKLFKYQEKIAD
jgi:NADH dehydrogenase